VFGGSVSPMGDGGIPPGGMGGASGSDAMVPMSDGAMPDAGSGVTATHGVLIPTSEWACGLPEGVPAPESGEQVLDLTLELEPTLELGDTPYGSRAIRITNDGTVSGDVTGSVLVGGLDWELTLPSGARQLETRHVLRAGNGSLIYMRGCGIGTRDITRLVVTLEAPSGGANAALQDGLYIATREVSEGSARFVVYRVPALTPDALASEPSETIVRTDADRALRPSVWNCSGPARARPPRTAPARRREHRRLARRGHDPKRLAQHHPDHRRHVHGMGKREQPQWRSDPGGADFQVTPPGGSFEIEARYTLRGSDGTLVAVRNCGGVGGTVPEFEAPLGSPYAFLNDGQYLGTIGLAIGGVVISVFEGRALSQTSVLSNPLRSRSRRATRRVCSRRAS